MINYFFENIDSFEIPEAFSDWLSAIIRSEDKRLGTVNYIFCDDEYLLKVNQTYLQHDYYTDVITFDYVKGKMISGDIFISLQRVSDNAAQLGVSYYQEYKRVLSHGILHLCGYKDKEQYDITIMRAKEEFYLDKFPELT